MPSRRAVLRFSGLLLLAWALLLFPWPGIDRAYASYFRFGGNVVFARYLFWPDATVGFRDPNDIAPGDLPPWADAPMAQREMDTVMVLEKRTVPGSISFLRTSSRLIGFLPTAIMIGLILATPMTWKKCGTSLLWGFLAVHAFIILRVALKLAVDGFSGVKPVALFNPGPWAASFWGGARTVLHEDPTVSLVVPVLIWLIFFFRPSRWEGMGQGVAGEA